MAKKADRRQQVRDKRTERDGYWWRRLYDAVGVWPLVICAAFTVLATFISLYGTHARDFRVGQRIKQPIYAEVDFEVPDEQETLRRQSAARAAVPSHFRLNHELFAQVTREIQDLYQAAQAAETFEEFQAAAGKQSWNVDAEGYAQLRAYAEAQGAARFESQVTRLQSELRKEKTWRVRSVDDRSPASTAEYVLVHENGAPDQPEDELKQVRKLELVPISNETSIRRAADSLCSAAGFTRSLRPCIVDILTRRMSEAPILVFDRGTTNEAMTQADAEVAPATIAFPSGRPFVSVKPDTGVTASDLALLDMHARAYAEYLKSDSERAVQLRRRDLLRQIGIGVICVLTSLAFFGYVGLYQRRVLLNHTRLLTLTALFVLTLLAARLIDARTDIKEFIYTPPIFAGSVLAIAYSRRFAIGAMAFVGVVLMLSLRADAPMLITMMVGVTATCMMLGTIRTRTRLLWVGAASSAFIFVTGVSFSLIDGQELQFALERGLWAAAACALSAMLLQTSLPLVERAFRIATSLTLLEWRDPTRPLLQRLAQEAPGTYAHSLAIGEMASAACEAIGANTLLTQVGALYHDIGKLNKPEYFTENQSAKINRHDKLAPTMSLLIIIGHVKDGIEMAREYKLPRVLVPFIGEHHGTTVVRYFHHLASEKQPQIASGKHDREVSEARFRYPGPKPRSKETAVLMICDGAEGAVRSLAEPTPGRIEQMVHQIVAGRLSDGQFDDCDITLRELHRVEDSLVKNLTSYYHGRVAYPKREKAEERTPQTSAAG